MKTKIICTTIYFVLLPITLIYSKIDNIKWINFEPDLKGKSFVVFEFFATWCIPCIKLFPKLEDYQKKFQNIVFIGISNESEKIIKKFIERKRVKLAIGKDIQNYWHNKYSVDFYPTIIVVDTFGNIIYNGNPFSVDENFFENLLNKKNHIGYKSNSANETLNTNLDTLFFIEFKKSSVVSYTLKNVSFEGSGVKFSFTNIKLIDLLLYALNIPISQILYKLDDTTHYDFSGFLQNYKIDDFKQFILSFLSKQLNFKIRKAIIKSKSLFVSVINPQKLYEFKVNPSEYQFVKHYSTNDSLCSTSNFSISDLAILLSDLFSFDIVYKGNNKDRFNFEFPLDFNKAKEIFKNEYGLSFKWKNYTKKLYIISRE